MCPVILVAAPASGQGKTTVASALARLHAQAGLRMQAFKCGPDFLDPHWLALATGQPVHNVDLWMTGEDDARARLHAAAGESDLIVVEGVMGLFDGEPSAAPHRTCARWCQRPRRGHVPVGLGASQLFPRLVRIQPGDHGLAVSARRLRLTTNLGQRRIACLRKTASNGCSHVRTVS